MSKSEVMASLRNSFEQELLPYVWRHVKEYQAKIRGKAIREKRKVVLDWMNYDATNNVQFQYRISGDAANFYQEYIAIFRWQRRTCFASFLDGNHCVIVFQNHSLERYSERVLGKSIVDDSDKIFKKTILKALGDSFYIVLPCPKREASYYLVAADALFLGDYYVPDSKESPEHIWLNTCISLKESSRTQAGILGSLLCLQDCIQDLSFNPIKDKERYFKIKNKILSDSFHAKSLRDYLTKYYLMLLLHLHFEYPFTKLFEDEIEENLTFLRGELKELGIAPDGLSPFGEKYGFALKGEIDYRG